MGLIGTVLHRATKAAVISAEIFYEVTDRARTVMSSNPLPEHYGAASAVWDGPDDLWPEEPVADPVEESQISDTASEPELLVHQQWGLLLPSGDIMWGSWNNLVFATPMDRVNVIANLQKTAEQCGFSEGEQTAGFLSHYGWVTRNQIATVVYEDTGAYTLTDPAVCATSTPSEETPDGQQDPDSPPHPGGDLCPGSVGGDT